MKGLMNDIRRFPRRFTVVPKDQYVSAINFFLFTDNKKYDFCF